MNWFKRWKLRRAQENYAEWKAEKEAMERLGSVHVMCNSGQYRVICGRVGRYEERVESLMREQ